MYFILLLFHKFTHTTAFARNHGEQRVRRELIGQLPDYVMKHENVLVLQENTLHLLLQCAEHDDAPLCRKRAVESAFALFKACRALQRTVDLAGFFLRRLGVETSPETSGGEIVARALIMHLGLTDKLMGVREARPEFEVYLSLRLAPLGTATLGTTGTALTGVTSSGQGGLGQGSGGVGTMGSQMGRGESEVGVGATGRRDREMVLLAVQSMNCYETIPSRYARIIADTLGSASDALEVRRACVSTLMAFAKKLDNSNEYVFVRNALLAAGRDDGELIVKWMVLETICELKDAGEEVMALLVSNLSNRAKDFLWWNRYIH